MIYDLLQETTLPARKAFEYTLFWECHEVLYNHIWNGYKDHPEYQSVDNTVCPRCIKIGEVFAQIATPFVQYIYYILFIIILFIFKDSTFTSFLFWTAIRPSWTIIYSVEWAIKCCLWCRGQYRYYVIKQHVYS